MSSKIEGELEEIKKKLVENSDYDATLNHCAHEKCGHDVETVEDHDNYKYVEVNCNRSCPWFYILGVFTLIVFLIIFACIQF